MANPKRYWDLYRLNGSPDMLGISPLIYMGKIGTNASGTPEKDRAWSWASRIRTHNSGAVHGTCWLSSSNQDATESVKMVLPVPGISVSKVISSEEPAMPLTSLALALVFCRSMTAIIPHFYPRTPTSYRVGSLVGRAVTEGWISMWV
jgi:hypothetical protein